MKERCLYLALGAVSLASAIPATVFAQGIVLSDQGPQDAATLKNSRLYSHVEDNNLAFNVLGGFAHRARAPFLLASQEDQEFSSGAGDSGGLYGDGDVLTLWNPGDGANSPSSPPAAFLYILDEDDWNDNDGDPYDHGALRAYLDATGLWQTSSRSQKTRIAPLEKALLRVQALHGYTYEFRLNESEIAKEQSPVRGLGVLAEELQAVLPEAVASNAYGEMWVNYSQITPLLIEAIKEQQALIQALQERVAALERGRPW